MKKQRRYVSRLLIALVLVIGASSLLIGCVTTKENSSSFQKEMVAAANEINAVCPIMADEETRLDNVVALPNNSFQYNYTLVNYAKKDIDVAKLKATVSPIILNNIKTNPDLQLFRDNKVTMIYSYKDKNGNFLFSSKYGYNDYK